MCDAKNMFQGELNTMLHKTTIHMYICICLSLSTKSVNLIVSHSYSYSSTMLYHPFESLNSFSLTNAENWGNGKEIEVWRTEVKEMYLQNSISGCLSMKHTCIFTQSK